MSYLYPSHYTNLTIPFVRMERVSSLIRISVKDVSVQVMPTRTDINSPITDTDFVSHDPGNYSWNVVRSTAM